MSDDREKRYTEIVRTQEVLGHVGVREGVEIKVLLIGSS